MKKIKYFECINEDKIDSVAKYILSVLKQNKANILILSGDLGAGKTTFVSRIAKILDVKESITSPTFVYMKKYKTKDPVFKNLIHIDAYRGVDTNFLKVDFSKKESLFAIEWADNLDGLKNKTKNGLVVEISDCRSTNTRNYEIIKI